MQDPLSCAEVRATFAGIDAATLALAARTGLRCPEGCGACCLSPEIEASEAELAPLAARLVREGRALALLDEIARRAAGGDTRCALYVPDPTDPRRGRCSEYADRPLLCRLFGFGARRDRLGLPALIACKTMRAASPETVARAEADVAAGGAVGSYGDAARPLRAQHGPQGDPRPIHDALRGALERALLRARLEGSREPEEAPVGADPTAVGPHALPPEPGGPRPEGPGRPHTPRRPRRRPAA